MTNEEVKTEPGQTAQQPPQTQPAAEEAPDLTITDLNSMRSIIDVATQRGAFRANELEAIGKVYNRLDKFLSAATKGQ